MVHALDEVRRVLAPGGLLIDLRPLLDQWSLEVSWMNGTQQVGRATDLPEPLSDDAAANAAMAERQDGAAFSRELEEEFPLYYYWDTPQEMQTYLEEEWDDVISVEETVWSRLKAAWASANADARVRLQMKLSITRYRKVN